MHFLGRQIKVSRSDVFHCEEFEFLEAHHLMRHMDFAVIVVAVGFHGFKDLYFRVGNGVGEIVGVDHPNVGAPLWDIQLAYVVLLALMQVNRFFVQR